MDAPDPRVRRLRELSDELRSIISAWPDEECPLSDDRVFDEWALTAVRAQRNASATLDTFLGPGDPASWMDVRPVPVSAFKAVPMGSDIPAEAVFETSGTTSGPGRPGRHRVLSMALYHAAARGNYRHALFPDTDALVLLALVPPVERLPHSSLSRMVSFMADEEEVAQTVWAFDSSDGVDLEAAAEAMTSGRPVLLISTAFALVALLNAVGDPWRLPPGSRLMETGGFKGRVAEVPRAELYEMTGRALGLEPSALINEYGMTELLSQSYDGVAGSAGPPGGRWHRFPPWVRTAVLHPETLQAVEDGTVGLLAHFDLANVGSVSYVLTEDLGIKGPAGSFRLAGRATGSDLRGCSLDAEAFLRAKGVGA